MQCAAPGKSSLAYFQEIINEADMDHNGLIDYTEFFMLMAPK